LRNELGEKGADFVYYGMPGLIGADISGSLVLGDEPFGENVFEKIGRAAVGPVGTIGIQAAQAVAAEPREPMTATEKLRAVARRIPTLRQFVELWDLAESNTDVMSPDGEIKYERKLRDVILGLGSFRSANEANIQTWVGASVELEKEKGELKNAFYVATRSRDSEAMADARKAITDFNKRWPESAIMPQEVQQYLDYRLRRSELTDVERITGRRYAPLAPPK
jgi:hypothetical protein